MQNCWQAFCRVLKISLARRIRTATVRRPRARPIDCAAVDQRREHPHLWLECLFAARNITQKGHTFNGYSSKHLPVVHSVVRRNYLRLRTLRRKFSPMGEKAKTSTMKDRNIRNTNSGFRSLCRSLGKVCAGGSTARLWRQCAPCRPTDPVWCDIPAAESFLLSVFWKLRGTWQDSLTCSMTPYDIKGLKRPPPTWPHAMCIFFMHCSIKKAITWPH